MTSYGLSLHSSIGCRRLRPSGTGRWPARHRTKKTSDPGGREAKVTATDGLPTSPRHRNLGALLWTTPSAAHAPEPRLRRRLHRYRLPGFASDRLEPGRAPADARALFGGLPRLRGGVPAPREQARTLPHLRRSLSPVRGRLPTGDAGCSLMRERRFGGPRLVAQPTCASCGHGLP